MKKRKLISGFVMTVMLLTACSCQGVSLSAKTKKETPKIVNIINFIRLLEPRDRNITEDVLYNTVVKQVEIMQEYNLGGTFLLQYDALLDSRYQKLLKSLPADKFEIGAWWEIPQPLVENAGMSWRGRYPWDWHADVGFSTGYTPEEREKFVDVYMADFKNIYGYYPKSVGSWFIDAHTLNYLYEKYHIIASCNCKDQVGTDGYTVWGGYWNQAYYPSKVNSYMPAQHAKSQIPVPIFRMLGSDPVRQYDTGIGGNWQGVITLEPVYGSAGGEKDWVDWYFDQFVKGEAMEFAYVQAGQENSFTWRGMEKGYKIQMPLIAKLRDEGKIKVETLAKSGEWFKKNYKVTPATSVTVNDDLRDSDLKTVWFNSRFYRMNILWENNSLRIRDIHLFDEAMKSDYLAERVDTNECHYFTLPLVDGFLWSTKGHLAGLRMKATIDGKNVLLKGGDPVVTNPKKGTLRIEWPLTTCSGTIIMMIDENQFVMKLDGNDSLDWYLDMSAAKKDQLPYTSISDNKVNCEFKDMTYSLSAKKGHFSKPGGDVIYRITPKDNTITLEGIANN